MKGGGVFCLKLAFQTYHGDVSFAVFGTDLHSIFSLVSNGIALSGINT